MASFKIQVKPTLQKRYIDVRRYMFKGTILNKSGVAKFKTRHEAIEGLRELRRQKWSNDFKIKEVK